MSTGDEPRDIFNEPSVAERLAEARKDTAFKRAVKRIRKWCPFTK